MALEDEFNALRLDLLKIATGNVHHASAGTPVDTPDTSDLATALTLATALRAAMVEHFADVCDDTTGVGAHRAADSTTQLPAETVATSGNLATFTAALAGALEDHCKRADLHFGPDGGWRTHVHAVPSETYVYRRLNAIKVALNAHMASALTSQPITE